jgi:hypothetical protein
MKTYGGVNIWIHVFFTYSLAGGEWSVSRLGRFTPGERVRDTYWIGDWVGPRAGLNDMVERIFLALAVLDLQPLVHPIRSQWLHRLSYTGHNIYRWNLISGYLRYLSFLSANSFTLMHHNFFWGSKSWFHKSNIQWAVLLFLASHNSTRCPTQPDVNVKEKTLFRNPALYHSRETYQNL